MAKLNAAEEKKSEINQFLNNAKRVQTDLEILDVALERVQNLLHTPPRASRRKRQRCFGLEERAQVLERSGNDKV